ncbi:hypothetical protein DYB32_004838 [Aphanomyces invadans]|uniref:Uncharacterized protein n=1 Tax=Aphanomyces invadans TaxID=157072 RepID=A0A418AW56_9STRA|nr:hypothetical protein DYB32_004838 [Aphanomyces invadans]
MGFRGIFLQRSQNPDDRGAAKFEVLCAEAELCLLVERQTMSDIDPSGVVDTKVLVKNAATTDLLFVARMADVTMEVGSMFWVDGTTVYCFRFVSDNSYAEVLRAVDALRRTEQLALMRSVLAFHPLGGSDGKDNPTKWKHYAACAKLDTTGAEVRTLQHGISQAKAYNKEWLITIDPKQPSMYCLDLSGLLNVSM